MTETEIRTELVRILDRLNSLPLDAFGERAELKERQAELRSALAVLQGDQLSEAKKQWEAQAGEKRRDDSQDVGMVVSPIEPASGP